MEIRDRKPSDGVATVRKQTAPAAAAAPATAVAPPPPRDVLALVGIPPAELTPNVQRALTTLMAEVEQLRRELGEARARIGHLEKLVDEDPLVPLVNRRAFVRELTRMLAFSERYGVPASVLYFDVNNMKQINDRYGHAAGDATLVEMAQVLLENVRTTDVVGRLGGDEMGVLLVQADQAHADRKAAELAALIEAHETQWQGAPIRLGVAHGAYAFARGDSASQIIDAADRAMYRTKASMKGPE
jgi:diguanylate cyclase (GGDEF)-like protein